MSGIDVINVEVETVDISTNNPLLLVVVKRLVVESVVDTDCNEEEFSWTRHILITGWRSILRVSGDAWKCWEMRIGWWLSGT